MTTHRLSKTIRDLHGCEADLIETVQVVDDSPEHEVWRGSVGVFALEGHPDADRCYAWEAIMDDGTVRTYTVLGRPPIDSATAAVQSAVAGERPI